MIVPFMPRIPTFWRRKVEIAQLAEPQPSLPSLQYSGSLDKISDRKYYTDYLIDAGVLAAEQKPNLRETIFLEQIVGEVELNTSLDKNPFYVEERSHQALVKKGYQFTKAVRPITYQAQSQ